MYICLLFQEKYTPLLWPRGEYFSIQEIYTPLQSDTHLNVLVKNLQGLPASLLVRPVLLSSKQGIAQKILVVLFTLGDWGGAEKEVYKIGSLSQ